MSKEHIMLLESLDHNYWNINAYFILMFQLEVI